MLIVFLNFKFVFSKTKLFRKKFVQNMVFLKVKKSETDYFVVESKTDLLIDEIVREVVKVCRCLLVAINSPNIVDI